VDFTGMDVKAMEALRRLLREQKIDFLVAKKTLSRLAFQKENFTNLEVLNSKGSLALGFAYEEDNQLFRSLYDYARRNENLKILAGFWGKDFLSKEKFKKVAFLPSREALLAEVISVMQAPVQKLVFVSKGILRNFVLVLEGIKQNKASSENNKK